MLSTATQRIFLAAVLLIAAGPSLAQLQPADRELVIGYHTFPGVVEHGSNPAEDINGMAIDLWREIVRENGWINFRFVEIREFGQIWTKLQQGEVDAVLGGLTITGTRERDLVDFSHPFMHTGTGVMVQNNVTLSVWKFIEPAFSKATLHGLLLFALWCTVSGFILWATDRGEGSSIDDRFFPGIFEGMWCSFQLGTTIGSGDIIPVRWLGRVLSVFTWIGGAVMGGLIFAQMTSSATIYELETDIRSAHDLRGKVVAVKAGTTSAALANRYGAEVKLTQTASEAIELLENGDVDVVIDDLPRLQRYIATAASTNLALLDLNLSPQSYGIAFPPGSELREPASATIADMEHRGLLTKIATKYFE